MHRERLRPAVQLSTRPTGSPDNSCSTAPADRHEANGVLFDKYFTDDEFKTFLREFLATTYDDFRDRGQSA